MDIVIAAAGKGTRLQAYTRTIPKHIIPVAGRPFLYYLLDAITVAGFRRIIIVGGHHFSELERCVRAYPTEMTIITVNQFDHVPEKNYGTACPLLAVETMIQGDRFVYTMGDHLLSARDLEHMQQSTRDSLVAAIEHPEPQRYGVIEMNVDHTVKKIVEKPLQPTSQLINVGLYTLSRTIFPVVRDLPTSKRGEFEITDALNQLAQRATLRVVLVQDQWLDLSRPEDVEALERFLKHT